MLSFLQDIAFGAFVSFILICFFLYVSLIQPGFECDDNDTRRILKKCGIAFIILTVVITNWARGHSKSDKTETVAEQSSPSVSVSTTKEPMTVSPTARTNIENVAKSSLPPIPTLPPFDLPTLPPYDLPTLPPYDPPRMSFSPRDIQLPTEYAYEGISVSFTETHGDYNHVGNEWSKKHYASWDGYNWVEVPTSGAWYSVSSDKTLYVKTVITEYDDSMSDSTTNTYHIELPISSSYNGASWTINQWTDVVENAGRYSGKSCRWYTDWTITYLRGY